MAIISFDLTGLENGEEYTIKVFSVNPSGRTNNRVDLSYVTTIPTAFPSEPTSYELIDTYTQSLVFTAPENGWYRIELFGGSGSGGNGASYSSPTYSAWLAGGGGGGGGGAAISIVKLYAGDTVVYTHAAFGQTATVSINSGMEIYELMQVTSGANGSNGSVPSSFATGSATGGNGGSGGAASGGNLYNFNGNVGGKGGATGEVLFDSSRTAPGGSGGTPGYSGGNTGGIGGSATKESYSTSGTAKNGSSGSPSFVKIFRGNTNLVI